MKTTIANGRPIESMAAQFLATCMQHGEINQKQAESLSAVVYAAMLTAISNTLLIQCGDRTGSTVHQRALAELLAESQFSEAEARAMVAQTNARHAAIIKAAAH